MNPERTPLRIYCRNCGSPAGFDIINQTYRCPSCGEFTGIQEVKEDVYQWRALNRDRQLPENAPAREEELSCPSCGALVSFAEGEASETCDFCGSRLVRAELSSNTQIPDMIIPFFITREEARDRLLQWGKAHGNTPEGAGVVSNIDRIKGYYLPYRLVRGPVYGRVIRDGNKRAYECAGYLEGSAVSTAAQPDNDVLDEVEPFDWSAARPFEYGYIAGHSVRLPNMSDLNVERLARSEAEKDFLPEIERVLQTTGVGVDVQAGELSNISVLLPIYFIKADKLTAVLNGQTGRIAVSGGRRRKSFPWMIEPLIYTILATLALWILSGFSMEMLFYGGMVAACIMFSVMGDGRTSLIRAITLRTKAARAARQDGELHILEADDILKNPWDNTPVFYEKDEDGRIVPVRIKFYTLGRWLRMLINIFIVIFLPGIIAAGIRLMEMSPGESFADGFRMEYGAAWYTVGVFIALLYLIKGMRRDVYDHPYLYEILPDGGKRLMGSRLDRKVSILSMFGIGQRDSNGKRVTIFRMLKSIGFGSGAFLVITVLGLLFGSVAAILS
ncbi:MAG: hypothetical protein IKE62_04620 [Oscillospiraceae bacterium]|nr:hypothetical protein [Oscillospiraceae bacterium]